MRRLASMSYVVAYEQDPRSEIDFCIKHLGTDLRSGLRLARIAELLLGTSHTSCGKVVMGPMPFAVMLHM